MVTIAQRIETLRVQKGLSRPALAAALGLPRMSVEKFETGRQTPSRPQSGPPACRGAVLRRRRRRSRIQRSAEK